MTENKKNLVVGIAGGGGGALVIGSLFQYAFFPSLRFLKLLLPFQIIGFSLIFTAIFLYWKTKKREKEPKAQRNT